MRALAVVMRGSDVGLGFAAAACAAAACATGRRERLRAALQLGWEIRCVVMSAARAVKFVK